ncbi:hypothetical protein CIPAW_09G164400 [Carya illinoinensis]|uniref:Uncharacterized protein n=1 Tax=Carya illinoinensis TaxID=32201 RepID=A0A8T1PP35_CARIL|nr:hypothetical protein CIPAW_09G164400 [Carya illinoinensis]
MDERLLRSEVPKETSNLPKRIWVESRKIWKVAFPSMISRVTQFGVFVVTQAFIGHIGEVDLAAYALVQIIAVRFVNGILSGMSSATETLCGQEFGAGQFHMLGIYLQRSWIINIVTTIILAPAFIFSTPIFELLGEEEDVEEVAGYISLWFIPVLYYFPFIFSIQKYLQAQLKNNVVGLISIGAFILHILLSWLFVIKLNFGIPGAMASMAISFWSVVIGMFIYVFGGWCPNIWRGFTVVAFQDLLPMVKLSISSGVMLWKIAYLFTSDEEVAKSVLDLSTLLGVAVGAGRQGLVAFINIGSYFLIGVPVGVLLAYVADLEIKGLWIGMIIGIMLPMPRARLHYF